MGGEWFGELFGDPGSVSEETLSQIALEELHRQLGIAAQPSFISTSILRDSIAQYAVGHQDKLSECNYYCCAIYKLLSRNLLSRVDEFSFDIRQYCLVCVMGRVTCVTFNCVLPRVYKFSVVYQLINNEFQLINNEFHSL